VTQWGSSSAISSLVEIGTTSSSAPWKRRIGRWKSSGRRVASRLCQSASMRAPIAHSTGSAANEGKPILVALKERTAVPVEGRGVEDEAATWGASGERSMNRATVAPPSSSRSGAGGALR
jgi:hypothetical protein